MVATLQVNLKKMEDLSQKAKLDNKSNNKSIGVGVVASDCQNFPIIYRTLIEVLRYTGLIL